MSTLTLSVADQERARGLRRMRFVATSLLAFAAIVYALTLRSVDITWVGFVNAAAEAAMVGACADWFAVTALFRHPLGIPVPHTALIRRRKDDLGRSLQAFVADYFLTEDVVRERLVNARPAGRLGDWLDEAGNRRRALQIGSNLSVTALGRLKDSDVTALVTDALLPRLNREELSPIAGTFLEGVVEDGAHQSLVDLVAREAHTWLRNNPETFAQVVGERAPRWSPAWIDRGVTNWTYAQAVGWLRDVRDQRRHPVRQALDDLLGTLARDLQHDPQVRRRFEALKERVLQHPQMGDTVTSLWSSVRASLLTALEDDSSPLWERADGWLNDFGARLRHDGELAGNVDARVQEAAGWLVRSYGPQVAGIISYTVERWDASEASTRIELFVGRDLQFIRINGTVVGALVGTLIHAISLLVR